MQVEAWDGDCKLQQTLGSPVRVACWGSSDKRETHAGSGVRAAHAPELEAPPVERDVTDATLYRCSSPLSARSPACRAHQVKSQEGLRCNYAAVERS